jgi:hypothetical protein
VQSITKDMLERAMGVKLGITSGTGRAKPGQTNHRNGRTGKRMLIEDGAVSRDTMARLSPS